MQDSRVPKVGVGVIVTKAGAILVGKRCAPRACLQLHDLKRNITRKGSHGSGKWSLPGGHLEFGESFEACAARELLEETGLELQGARFVWACNTIFDTNMHYVTIFVQGTLPEDSAEAQNLEPEKCEGWEWHALDAVPQPHFEPLAKLVAHNGMHLIDAAAAVTLAPAVHPTTPPSSSRVTSPLSSTGALPALTVTEPVQPSLT